MGEKSYTVKEIEGAFKLENAFQRGLNKINIFSKIANRLRSKYMNKIILGSLTEEEITDEKIKEVEQKIITENEEYIKVNKDLDLISRVKTDVIEDKVEGVSLPEEKLALIAKLNTVEADLMNKKVNVVTKPRVSYLRKKALELAKNSKKEAKKASKIKEKEQEVNEKAYELERASLELASLGEINVGKYKLIDEAAKQYIEDCKEEYKKASKELEELKSDKKEDTKEVEIKTKEQEVKAKAYEFQRAALELERLGGITVKGKKTKLKDEEAKKYLEDCKAEYDRVLAEYRELKPLEMPEKVVKANAERAAAKETAKKTEENTKKVEKTTENKTEVKSEKVEKTTKTEVEPEKVEETKEESKSVAPVLFVGFEGNSKEELEAQLNKPEMIAAIQEFAIQLSASLKENKSQKFMLVGLANMGQNAKSEQQVVEQPKVKVK